MPAPAAFLLALTAACSSSRPKEPSGEARGGDRPASAARADPERPTTSTARASMVASISSTARDCPAMDVRSVRIGAVSDPLTRVDTLPERIETLPASAAAPATTTILATGPILGSMDSREVQTAIDCTAEGATVTAMLTRSADYAGGVKKNVLWRPTLTVVLEPHAAAATVRVTWRMRLTTSVELDRAQTPPYQEVRYPRSLEARIAARR